jgi:hypothetical protein
MEDMACNVLRLFDSASDDLINGVLLLQKIPYFKIDCLKMGTFFYSIRLEFNPFDHVFIN